MVERRVSDEKSSLVVAVDSDGVAEQIPVLHSNDWPVLVEITGELVEGNLDEFEVATVGSIGHSVKLGANTGVQNFLTTCFNVGQGSTIIHLQAVLHGVARIGQAIGIEDGKITIFSAKGGWGAILSRVTVSHDVT